VFIVQGKRREPEGGIEVVKTTRSDALDTALDFLIHGVPFVTIVADGRIYTPSEFVRTLGSKDSDGPEVQVRKHPPT
jgi:hypothetical protein